MKNLKKITAAVEKIRVGTSLLLLAEASDGYYTHTFKSLSEIKTLDLSAATSLRWIGSLPADLEKVLSSLNLFKVSKLIEAKANSTLLIFTQERKVRIEKAALLASVPAAAPIASTPVVNTPPQKKRVLIVDDSTTIQQLLKSILEKDPDLQIVGIISNPLEVEDFLKNNAVDVMTLDVHMPHMTGVDLLRKMSPSLRVPTVMITSVSREEGTWVFDALEAGAVDYIQKPQLKELDRQAPLICEKVKEAAAANTKASKRSNVPKKAGTGAYTFVENSLIALGASTGGTEALKEVLLAMAPNSPPIVIVQHIPPVFSRAFAERLDKICPVRVKEAVDGEEILAGTAYVAPGDWHMRIKKVGTHRYKIVLDQSPAMNRHRPAVDILFDSVAAEFKGPITAAILTGMGKDGAKGLLKLKQGGARTIAQDQATSVVYGMPREAKELGGADQVLPLEAIADALMKNLKTGKKAA